MTWPISQATVHRTFRLALALLRSAHPQAEAYAAWRVYRNTLAELNELSVREMADLGINPSMVRRIALEAAYGKNV